MPGAKGRATEKQGRQSAVPLAPKVRDPKEGRADFSLNAVAEPPAATEATVVAPKSDLNLQSADMSAITEANPLKVIIAGAGVGGLALANDLLKDPKMHVTVLERTGEFKRFGGPIQLASNALQTMKEMDEGVYDKIMEKFTFTGDKRNGILDGVRNEWYAEFDLGGPAVSRGMPYTGVIERPDLQQIYLDSLPAGVVQNGDGVANYTTHPNGKGVKVITDSGAEYDGDVVIGADGIWSNVRATMRSEPAKGEGSGASYSGYTVFAGELTYGSYDNGDVGYKVFIGPGQYFVITDIGNGRYQWYAFLARPADSAAEEEKPDGSAMYLKNLFVGWSEDIHHILNATTEDEIQQRDLYDRPPSVRKAWTVGPVALLGDAVHAMMPNLGQGGCQAIEDSFVISQELKAATHRGEINDKLQSYRNRRLIRASTVQGLSRFASDIIINGFDTPAKIVFEGGLRFENFNYAGIVTKMLQPILPIFFNIQFNFLYSGWRNEAAIDYKAAAGISLIGFTILLAAVGFDAEVGLGLGLGLENLFGADAIATFAETSASVGDALGGAGDSLTDIIR
jgi:zeaxanthin epoxidase